MWYKVDFKRLGILFLPMALRKPKLIALTHSLLAPLISLHYTFTQNRNENLYKLQHNGQVCYLRKALNDAFDNTLRRIIIVDGNQFYRVYIYTEPELRPQFLKTIYLRDDVDYGDTGVDFIVIVPQDTYNEFEMKTLIDFYKLAGMRYKIEIA